MRLRLANRPGPGGVDDGLPQLPDGEPVLHRWFAIALVALVPLGLVVIGWAFLAIGRPELTAAERRPPGTATVTHDRGDAVVGRIRTAEPGPECAAGVTMVGDDSARAALRRALSATCQLLRDDRLAVAREGLAAWQEHGGLARIAVFERTGVDSSARLEDGRVVIELNPKFQFGAGERATPAIVHELAHLAGAFPGAPVTAEDELAAARLQHAACERLVFAGGPPRGCRDVAELLDSTDPVAELVAAGYRSTAGGR